MLIPMLEPRERKRYEHAMTTAVSSTAALARRPTRVVVIPVHNQHFEYRVLQSGLRPTASSSEGRNHEPQYLTRGRPEQHRQD